MDPIEKAIRNAFEKGDPRDPAFREQVYRSAFTALERALQANPGTTVERAIAKRKELESRIRQFETEFAAPPAVSVDPDGDGPVGTAPSVEIGLDRRGEPGGSRPEASLGDAMAPADGFGRRGEQGELAADPARVRKLRRRGWVGTATTLLVVLAALGLGGWWLLGEGLSELGGTPDGTPPRTVEDELAGEEPGAGGPLSSSTETRDWVIVFKPDDASTVGVPEGGEAKAADTEGIPFLRVRSGEGGEPVRFAVSREVLAGLRARKAVFDVVARTEDGTETQAAVSCDFGGFGACNRKRYAVTDAARADFLFDVEFPDAAPKGGGTIALDTDVTGGGKAIDVYEIRVSASD